MKFLKKLFPYVEERGLIPYGISYSSQKLWTGKQYFVIFARNRFGTAFFRIRPSLGFRWAQSE
jgi:hypothetical protein